MMEPTRHPSAMGRVIVADFQSVRAAVTWTTFGLLTGVGVTLAVILVSGISVADEAGAPIGVDLVSVSPAPSTTPSGQPTPGATRTGPPSSTNGAEIVPAPTPVEVDIDDHGGDDDSDKTSDDSGGNSGSGSGSNSGSSGGSGGGK